MKVDARALAVLVGVARGDMRGCINALQVRIWLYYYFHFHYLLGSRHLF